MKALLTQQGLSDVLKGEGGLPEGLTKEERVRMMEKAHSAIILCLGDKVLREVSRETTAAGVWTKLESLYMTKSLANRLYMKQRLYSYKISDGKSILDQLDEFNKAVDDLENIEVTLEDEDKAIILLNALPKSFDHLKDAMLYGREASITLEEVQSALKAKEIQKESETKQSSAGESLNVKGKQFKKKFKKGGKEEKKPTQSDERETRKCHYCKKPGHLKKDCFLWKKKQEMKKDTQDSADNVEQLENAEVLNILSSKIGEEWILDTGCTFHMCPTKSWFEDLQEQDLGSVILGNNEVCPVKGIGSIRLKTDDGDVRLLTEVRYIPSIKRNLISLGLLEKKRFQFQFFSRKTKHL